jgi:hypothetical protein
MGNRFGNHFKLASSTRVFAGAGAAAAIAGAFVVGRFNPVSAGFFPACPLHALTGFNCPGCGLTRGFHALFSSGDVLAALHFNALLPVYLFVFAYFFVALLSIAARGRAPAFNIFRPNLIWSFLIISVVFGVVRNFPVYPFTLLAP